MNEAETRAELIDPKLKESGWGVVDGSKILREYNITAGKIQTGGGRAKPLIADYVLMYQGRKLSVIEAKSDGLEVGEGAAQAKKYAEKLKLDTNGREIYQICMKPGYYVSFIYFNPASSLNPHITFIFCTAWPAAPLIKLSMAERSTILFSVTFTAISQKFVWLTSFVFGRALFSLKRIKGSF